MNHGGQALSGLISNGWCLDDERVLAQLEPVLDVDGAVHIGLSTVNKTVPGSYPVTVIATDTWGFTATKSATVTVAS